MIKLRDLITEGKPRAGDYVKVVTGEVGQINKVKGKIAWIKLASNKKSFFPSDIKNLKPTGKREKGKTLWTEGILTEGKITSDVDRAAKKLGIKFKKKVKTVFTNDFTGVNEPGEKVKYDDWMDYNPKNYKSQGMGLVSELMGKYIMEKNNRFTNGATAVFINRKKDPKSRFTIQYNMSFSGAYISYTGVKGQ
jgi:desulfoferrodoxin (superoxide reductase-like protein)